jgi:dTDP-4-dehydrorhamnose reductase
LRLLITGASGLLGAKLLQAASHAGHEVFATYNQHPVKSPNALQADLRNQQDIRKIIQQSSPEVVIHSASITDVDLCERKPELAFLVNGTATSNLAQACVTAKSHLVYLSTDYVFDGRRGMYEEGSHPNPLNTYGRSKLAGEIVTRKASESFSIARTSVVYGWGREFRPNFATWIYTKLRAGETVKVVEGQYSSPTLNSQLARMLLEVGEKHLSGIIHLAGASRLSRFEFALEIAREFHMDQKLIMPADLKSTSWVAERPADSSLNVDKAQSALANKPVSISEALNEFAREAGI